MDPRRDWTTSLKVTSNGPQKGSDTIIKSIMTEAREEILTPSQKILMTWTSEEILTSLELS